MIAVTREGRGPRMLGMMGIVLACAMGFGAIREPSPFGGLAVVVSSIAAVLVATIAAVVCRPRAFWFGLACGGWASLLLATPLLSSSRSQIDLPAARAWIEADQEGFNRLLRRCDFGMPQFRMIVLAQFAMAQGIACGAAAMFLARGGRFGAGMRRAGTRPGACLVASSALIASILAVHSCAWLGGPVFLQLVLVGLFAATLGSMTGPYRPACLIGALFGWIALIVMLESPPASTLIHGLPDLGDVYHACFVMPDESGGWSAQLHRLLFGDRSEPRWTPAWTSPFPGHRNSFELVLAHVTALWAMLAGLALGRRAARPRIGETPCPTSSDPSSPAATS